MLISPLSPRFGDLDYTGAVKTSVQRPKGHSRHFDFAFEGIDPDIVKTEIAKRAEQVRNQAIIRELAGTRGESMVAKITRIASAKWTQFRANAIAESLFKKELQAKKTAKIPG